MNLKNKIILSVYLPIALTLGVFAQLTSDAAWSAVCYSLIILDLAVAFLLLNKNEAAYFTLVALFFTAVADYFLVASRPDREVLGVLFFIPAQLFWFLRVYISEPSGKLRKIHLFSRILLNILSVFIPLSVLGDGADFLSVISVIYFVNILLNAVFSLALIKRLPFLSLGLVLFLLCDIFVGLGSIDNYLKIEVGSLVFRLAHTGLNMPWIFYAPAQIMLTLSMIETKKDGC